MIKGGIVAAVIGIGVISTLGTTSAANLAVGDCFLTTDETEIDRLDTPDCSEPHDAQIIATVALTTAEYPSDLDPVWETVFDSCVNAGVAAITDNAVIPDDAFIDMFTPSPDAFEDGERDVLCFISSPSGLNGSVMALPE